MLDAFDASWREGQRHAYVQMFDRWRRLGTALKVEKRQHCAAARNSKRCLNLRRADVDR
jgi:hypothetical protein